jgi:SAM-dependent methyltransferase
MSRLAERVANLVEHSGLDLELFLMTELLGLRSLHYGYWGTPPAPGELNLASLRGAQARFTARLLSVVPPGVGRVLDVGAGIGDNARALARRGYTVTALSPDKNHRRYFDALRGEGVTFYQTTFEELALDARFDLILISEALNYIDRERGLSQCLRYLREGGYLLVAAMFRYRDDREFGARFRPQELPYIKRATARGLSLEDVVDITLNVAPTMELANRALRYFEPPVRGLLQVLARLGGPFDSLHRELEGVWRYYQKRTDPAYFRRSVRYLILRFRRSR